MLSALAVSSYVLPPPRVSVGGSLIDNQRSQSSQLGRLAKLAASLARGRADLRDQSDRFDELYREAEKSELMPEELEEGARAIFANEDLHGRLSPSSVTLNRATGRPFRGIV